MAALRVLPCAPLALGLALAGLDASAAPLAARPYGNAMGDGLGDGLTFSDANAGPQAVKMCAAGDTLPGIDVSYYQGTIDWNAVAADGIVFAYVRVTHGLQFEDPKFQENLAGARAAGIHTGVYQFFEPSQDPIAQADKLLTMTGPLQPGDMPPMLDVESQDLVGKTAYADAIRAWLDHVEAATGVAPFIYSGYYYWNDNVGTSEFIDHPLWIPNYNAGCPLIPDYWPTWAAHQYCDCGSVSGIAGPVDVDTFNGGLDALMGYTVGGAVCGDAKCTFGEDPFLCPADCPPCGTIAPDGGTIDNGAACLELHGDLEYWRDEAVGEGGSLVWTNATEYATASNYAIWRLYFAEAGTYSLETFVEQPFGESEQTSYRVQHAMGETVIPVDQSQASGWVSLGEYTFAAATDHSVRIDDNTGELVTLERSLVADALRITRVDLEPATGTDTLTGDPGTSDTSDTSDTSGTAGTADTSGTTGEPTSDTGEDPIVTATASPTSDGGLPTTGDSTGATGSGGPGLPEDYGDDGCGCRSTPRPAATLAFLTTLLLLLRRRRVHASTTH